MCNNGVSGDPVGFSFNAMPAGDEEKMVNRLISYLAKGINIKDILMLLSQRGSTHLRRMERMVYG